MTLTELLQHFDREHPRSGFTMRRHPELSGFWVASAYIWQVQDTDPATAVRDLYRLIESRTIRTLPKVPDDERWARMGVVYRTAPAWVIRYAESLNRPIPEEVPTPFSIVWDPVRCEECLYAPKPEVTP